MPHREILLFAELGAIAVALGLSVGVRRLAQSRHWAGQRALVLVLIVFAGAAITEMLLVRS